jgi:hypothetical protein
VVKVIETMEGVDDEIVIAVMRVQIGQETLPPSMWEANQRPMNG